MSLKSSLRTLQLRLLSQCRRYSTNTRDYATAIADLNSLQSNFSLVQKFNESRDRLNAKSFPEMVELCQKIGYEVST